MSKLPTYNTQQWAEARDAVMQEYQDYVKELHEQGVDFTIKNARKLLIFQDLIDEWQHHLPTVISDLEENGFALSVFDELKKRKKSTLLERAYQNMSSWSNFNPLAITLWLELSEDEAITEY
ncbi:hypothetical protein FD04_GL002293 [Secundilactobacillus odoratitofui DSM 19909 = JCM 15043]|uniref:Uncharacterized protein n=1 Tax=Secundilactobacillus odoratitofui DSM 19909 = JCM 15043 TaxID=1423776 RepID=A0A0R1M107_9LACO|nr:hypothetical protein [Secundilactobacillus odoratitofui]KRK99475.1 hypothetical protein FD04_GL002293 [Secundilactobacillus odoratitofui DSM 19909 = JCM 15043]